MAHNEQVEFCKQVKELYPSYFDGVYVLDAGSLDINGNNQYLFSRTHYIGLDVGEGKNVDIVSKIHELQLPENTFDTIISTEVFEHDMHYADSVKNIYRMLKPGGMFVFTCATTGRAEHGTSRTTPQDAPLLQSDGEWQDYYKNLTENDIREIFDLDRHFYKYQFIVNEQSHDLYFWGIKNGIWTKRNDKSYHIDSSIINVELNKKNQELAEVNKNMRVVRDELKHTKDVLIAKKSELQETKSAQHAQERELNWSKQALQIKNSEIESLKTELTSVYMSRSWRLTKVLRDFVRFTRK